MPRVGREMVPWETQERARSIIKDLHYQGRGEATGASVEEGVIGVPGVMGHREGSPVRRALRQEEPQVHSVAALEF